MKTNKGVKFCISFDTKEMPGKVVAITVELDKWIMNDTDVANVALVDHPLYHHLVKYVKSNPIR